MTWLPRHPLTVSPWRLPRHPLTASPWYGSLAIHSLPHHDMALSPFAHYLTVTWLSRYPLTASPWPGSLAMTWLPHHPLTAIVVGRVPTGRLPVGKLLRSPLVACCITVLSLRLPTDTPQEENCVGSLCSRRWTLSYIALSHFLNDWHSSRQHYPSLSLECPRRLWWSNTLECSVFLSHGIVPVAVPLTGVAGVVASEASQVAYH
jgi:hypothetical protein